MDNNTQNVVTISKDYYDECNVRAEMLEKKFQLATETLAQGEDCPDEFYMANIGCHVDNEHLQMSCTDCWRKAIERSCK